MIKTRKCSIIIVNCRCFRVVINSNYNLFYSC
nr:MAG TPA: hypothetical protein [Caudoviricetes sp.]